MSADTVDPDEERDFVSALLAKVNKAARSKKISVMSGSLEPVALFDANGGWVFSMDGSIPI